MLDFLFLRHAAVKASQRSGYIQPAHSVSIYADNSVGVKLRLAKIPMKEVRSNKEEDAKYLKITSRDVIPGAGSVFRTPPLPYDGSGFFFLPKQSLIYWQRLWYFVAKTSFAMESVHDHVPELQSGSRSKNFRGDIADATMSIVLPLDLSTNSSPWEAFGALPSNIALVLYGGLHLLAWKYSFRSTTETILWKMAGVLAASSGITALLLVYIQTVAERLGVGRPATNKLLHGLSLIIDIAATTLVIAWIPINIIARTFLFVESFVALPNSPPSTYQIPNFAAYIALI
jgi:hypothetical protein